MLRKLIGHVSHADTFMDFRLRFDDFRIDPADALQASISAP